MPCRQGRCRTALRVDGADAPADGALTVRPMAMTRMIRTDAVRLLLPMVQRRRGSLPGRSAMAGIRRNWPRRSRRGRLQAQLDGARKETTAEREERLRLDERTRLLLEAINTKAAAGGCGRPVDDDPEPKG
jgi:hypothetical protein